MNRKLVLALALTLLVSMLNVAFNILPATASLPVHNVDTGLSYATIQEAINAATDGDTIQVMSGTYYEGQVVINKSLSLIADGTVIVDGLQEGHVFLVMVCNVTIEGFVFRNSKPTQYLNFSGICLSSVSDCRILNCTAEDSASHLGIYLSNSFGNTLIGNSVLSQSPPEHVVLENSSKNSFFNNQIPDLNLRNSDQNVIEGNNVSGYFYLINSDGNIVQENQLAETRMYNSRYNTVDGNTVSKATQDGLVLTDSFGNTVSGNNLTENGSGLSLWNSTENNMQENRIWNSGGIVLGDCSSNNVITSNSVFQNSGYFGICIQDSNYNTVSSNSVSSSKQGFYITSSYQNRICDNEIMNCSIGIYAVNSGENVIQRNSVCNSSNEGIDFFACDNDFIDGNSVTNNTYGIKLDTSGNITTKNNRMTNNGVGILLSNCATPNIIMRNAFLNNTLQAFTSASILCSWDSGYPSGGNYWSDYTGTDTNSDGIGDRSYEIDRNNTDHFPLMGIFSDFNTSYSYVVGFISDSSISNFNYAVNNQTIFPPEAILAFNVTGESGTHGFVRICIPKILFNDSYIVRFDGQVITNATYPKVLELPCSNETYEYLYINYTHSEHTIEISGTTTIPEFPSFLVLPLFMIATLLAVIVYRKKGMKTRQS